LRVNQTWGRGNYWREKRKEGGLIRKPKKKEIWRKLLVRILKKIREGELVSKSPLAMKDLPSSLGEGSWGRFVLETKDANEKGKADSLGLKTNPLLKR